jgi:hypothetical protein
LLCGGFGVLEEANGDLRHNFLNDLWSFDTVFEKWSLLRQTDDHRLTPIESDDAFPSPRYTPVFQAVGDELFLFGGYTEDRFGKRKLNDAWVYSDNLWQKISGEGKCGYTGDVQWPGLRYGSMSSADAKNIYVCGGFSDKEDHIDLWRFDLADRRFYLLSPDQVSDQLLHPRYCAAFAISKRKLFLFGARSRKIPKSNFNDLWEFDLDTALWSRLSCDRLPHRYDSNTDFPGYHAKASSAVAGKYWYIWGGEGLHGHVSDFWRFDFEKLEWQLIQGARSDDPVFW